MTKPTLYSPQQLARKLDYTLYSREERQALVDAILQENNYGERLAEDMCAGKIVTDSTYQAKQLETLANFILFGKSLDTNKNDIEEKTISKPDTRYSTFTRKTPVSLDELAEHPTFDEQETRPIERNSYLNPKRTITRPLWLLDDSTGELFVAEGTTHDSQIAGMIELWESVDRLEWLAGKTTWPTEPFSRSTYLVNGRRVRRVMRPVLLVDGVPVVATEPPPAPPKLSPLELYRVKHWLIDQKKHQYYLKESNSPTAFAQHFSFTPPTPIDWEEDSGYWITRSEARRLGKSIDLGKWRWRKITLPQFLVLEEEELEDCARTIDCLQLEQKNLEEKRLPREQYSVKEYFHLVAEHTIDFTNPLHIYALLENFRSLRIHSYDKLNSQMRHILDALEEIVDQTPLDESREIILFYKVHKWTNERIMRELAEFGYSYASNYISTIYKKEICGKIALHARRMDEEWAARNDLTKWQRCTRCGTRKLATQQNFTSKPKNYGGLSYQCKDCDRERREERKING